MQRRSTARERSWAAGSAALIEERRRIGAALVNGAEDARQPLLSVGALRGAIAATDFAGDHRQPERLFGPPVGGVDRVELKQKGEHFGKLDGEIRGEIARDAPGARPIEQRIQLIVEMPGRRSAMSRDGIPIAIADRECVLEHPLDPWRKVVFGRRSACDTAAADGRGTFGGSRDRSADTGTSHRARAGELYAQDGGCLREAAPRKNGVDRRVRRGKVPEPAHSAANFKPVSSGLTTALCCAPGPATPRTWDSPDRRRGAARGRSRPA